MSLSESAIKRPSQLEFIGMMAMLSAVVAFSIDAFLPAMSDIAAELSPDQPSHVQWVITAFLFGLGLGSFIAGALSDAFGRKPVLIGGVAIYVAGALAATYAPTLTHLLIARAAMGLGAAGPRIATMALTRDLYSGRTMAQIMSWISLIFSIFPAIAPTLGAGVIAVSGWRGVFLASCLFASTAALWLMIRQPETLHRDKRRPVRFRLIFAAVREMAGHSVVVKSLITQTLVFGMLFSVLASTQLIFDGMFDRGDTFHYWFGAMAIAASSSSYVNARLVVRMGMRAMVRAVLFGQVLMSALMLSGLATLSGDPLFAVLLVWTTSQFFMAGMTIGNLNALALEPMGHIAGLASSILSSFATVGAVVISGVLAAFFDGTPLFIALGTMTCAALGLVAMQGIKRAA